MTAKNKTVLWFKITVSNAPLRNIIDSIQQSNRVLSKNKSMVQYKGIIRFHTIATALNDDGFHMEVTISV